MSDTDRERAAGPEIATSTLAEIYAQQGLHDRALDIYRRIARRSPGDARVAARIAELERARTAVEGDPVEVTAPAETVEAAEPAAPGTDETDEAEEAEAPPPPAPAGDAAAPERAAAPPAAEDEEFQAWLSRR